MDADSRRALETRMTPGEFLRTLIDREAVKFPAKRYRVEGSDAGNSYILDLEDAQRTRQKYGGTIVELVSSTAFHGATAKFIKNACEECDAERGKPCLDNLGNITAPHDVRMGKTTRADRAALKLPECGTCKAKAGRPCRNKGGRKQMPHPARRPKKEKVPVAELDTCGKCGTAAGEPCRGKGGSKTRTHAGRERRQEVATS